MYGTKIDKYKLGDTDLNKPQSITYKIKKN